MSESGVELGIAGVVRAQEIGRGGFAAVYRAFEPDFRREVAVKVIIVPSLDESAKNRFRRECETIGSLSGHPHIVAVHQSGFTANGLPYLIMDFVPGGSLADIIADRGPMPWEKATEIAIKIAKTLDYAHSHLVLHRDVKPANILVSRFGEPLLADFGIAWALDSSKSYSAFISGTPAFAPPETWTDREPTVSGDIYSLGATLHALLRGKPPFESTTGNLLRVFTMVAEEPPPDLRPLGVPEALAQAVEWAMAKDPDQRPDSAAAFAAHLEQVVAKGDTSKASPPPEADSPDGLTAAAQAEPAHRPKNATKVAPVAVSGPQADEPVLDGAAPGGPGAVVGSTAGADSGAVSPRRRISRRIILLGAAAIVAVAAFGGYLALRPKHRSIPHGPAGLNSPAGIAIDGTGRALVADTGNNRVLAITADGHFTTFAGSIQPPRQGNGDGGPATAARLDSPQALATDTAGDVFIVESSDIRKVGPTGIISTVPVHVPGAGENSISAQGIAVSPDGTLVVSTSTDVVRVGADGSVTVLAGTGQPNFFGDGKPATEAMLNNPHGLAFAPNGNLFIADSANNRIRTIATDGTIDTVVGPGGGNLGDSGPALDAQLNYPTGILFDAKGDLYITEYSANRVRRVDAITGIITTVAGLGTGDAGDSGDGGPATSAALNTPVASAVTPGGDLYVTDGDNNSVRLIRPNGVIATVA